MLQLFSGDVSGCWHTYTRKGREREKKEKKKVMKKKEKWQRRKKEEIQDKFLTWVFATHGVKPDGVF
jgi:hypothetical protein